MGKADLHIHTTYSWDGTCSVTAVLKQASQNAQLDVIAITDHDEIKGALEAQQMAPSYGIEVILGSEITTADGHLLALFIQQTIPPGQSLIETVRAVANAGGLCIAAHPTAYGASSLTGEKIREALTIPEIAHTLVGIEVFNAGLVYRRGNIRAQALAHSLPLAPTGSSDSHILWTIGKGVTNFSGKDAGSFRRALETHTTSVRIGKGVQPAGLILRFLRGYLLRKAGWIECNCSPQEPISLCRASSSVTL